MTKTLPWLIGIAGAGIGAYVLLSKKKEPIKFVDVVSDVAVKVGAELIKQATPPTTPVGGQPTKPPFRLLPDPKKIGGLVGGIAGQVALDTKIPFTREGYTVNHVIVTPYGSPPAMQKTSPVMVKYTPSIDTLPRPPETFIWMPSTGWNISINSGEQQKGFWYLLPLSVLTVSTKSFIK